MSTATAQSFETVYAIAQQRFGQRPSVQTVWRWVRKGVKGGIKLQAVNHGGQWHTTVDWFDEFIERQTEAALHDDLPAATDEDLAEEGLI